MIKEKLLLFVEHARNLSVTWTAQVEDNIGSTPNGGYSATYALGHNIMMYTNNKDIGFLIRNDKKSIQLILQWLLLRD